VSRLFLAVNIASYWLLRYLVPFLLLAVFGLSALLAPASELVLGFSLLQGLFYFLAGVGYLAERSDADIPIADIAFSYCWANAGVFVGVAAFIRGTRIYAYASSADG